jgi:hypothetical protein
VLKRTLADPQPGFQLAESGRAALIADLEAQGWACIWP